MSDQGDNIYFQYDNKSSLAGISSGLPPGFIITGSGALRPSVAPACPGAFFPALPFTFYLPYLPCLPN
jgi:hypothetical protein